MLSFKEKDLLMKKRRELQDADSVPLLILLSLKHRFCVSL